MKKDMIPEQVADVAEIVKKNINHIYVSYGPSLNYYQKKALCKVIEMIQAQKKKIEPKGPIYMSPNFGHENASEAASSSGCTDKTSEQKASSAAATARRSEGGEPRAE